MWWIFRFFNTNVIHNLLNLLIGINGIVLWAGCEVSPTGQVGCTQAWIPPEIALAIIAISAPLKLIINIVRDGFPGLFMNQPPVVSDVTRTVVQVVPAKK